MDAIVILKVTCSITSVVAGAASSVYWFKSSRAEILFGDPRVGDDITYHMDGKDVAMAATAREQSRLSARGAALAAISVLLQAFVAGIDTWKDLI